MIVENVAAAMKIAPSLLGGAASDLLHPLFIRMSSDAGYADPAAFQMEKEQHIIGNQSSPGEHFHGEEVGSSQHIHVRGNKVFPRSGPASLGSRSDAVSAKNVAHRLIRNLVT